MFVERFCFGFFGPGDKQAANDQIIDFIHEKTKLFYHFSCITQLFVSVSHIFPGGQFLRIV